MNALPRVINIFLSLFNCEVFGIDLHYSVAASPAEEQHESEAPNTHPSPSRTDAILEKRHCFITVAG